MVDRTLKASGLGVFIVVALAASALAKDNAPPKTQDLLAQCGGRPVGPAIPGAESLDKEKLGFVRKDVQAFLRDADKFQECLALIIEAPGLTDTQKTQITRLEDQVQSEKEIVAGQFNKMVDAVNVRVGGAPKPAATTSAMTEPPSAQPTVTGSSSGQTAPASRPTALAVPKPKPAVPAQ